MNNHLNLQHFRVCRDDRDVVTVWIQHASRSMNVFDDQLIAEMKQIVDSLESDARLRCVVFRSAKDSGFFAGADVHTIATVSPEAADHVLRTGQALFGRIANLAAPTVAAIAGVCLGGGLEFALACRYRIAQISRSTRLGLPEVQLGIIPGWGGTQRLPARVGLTNALPMILQGKKLTAHQALKIGLVDAIAPQDDWIRLVEQTVTEILDNPDRRNVQPRQSLGERFLNRSRIGRALTFHTARRRIAGDSHHYPALRAALRAIAAGFKPSVDGFQVERKEFARMLETPTCRNLLNLFLQRELARDVDTWITSAPDQHNQSTIRKLAIIGAGAMGAGIGQLAAQKGIDVVLKELDDELAQSGRERIESLFEPMVSRRLMSAEDALACMQRVSVTSQWEPVTDADVVVEAVVERMDVKSSVFTQLDRTVKPGGILASNTSSLSVSEMAKATQRADSVAGLHFFNPVHRMDLVEVVRGRETADHVVADLVRLVRHLGKTPIVTRDSPGFLVNRILFPYAGEAMELLLDGHGVEEIDNQARGFGMPMGPLELLDHVGLDVAFGVSSSMSGVLQGSQRSRELLRRMVAEGWMGKKRGRGFYHYDGKRKVRTSPMKTMFARLENHELSRPQPLYSGFLYDDITHVQRRLIYPLINEAVRCLDESVVQQAWMVDLAMVLGTGFAPMRGGPLATGQRIGWTTVLHNMQLLHDTYGERFEPAIGLTDLANGKQALNLMPEAPRDHDEHTPARA